MGQLGCSPHLTLPRIAHKPRRLTKCKVVMFKIIAITIATYLLIGSAHAQLGQIPSVPGVPGIPGRAPQWTGQQIGSFSYWNDNRGNEWTGQRLGNTDYWDNNRGQSFSCRQIGAFTYCD